jgi:glycosyltransferase involved in cell wall biosynthesis
MEPVIAAIDEHKQISYSEPVQHEEMPKQLGRCSIFVLPSRSEAMGRVLVEAMAAGKPRIGANIDGIPTVINDGVDGLLVEPNSIDDLAEKLDLLMSDSDLRKKLGVNGRKRAREEFNKDVYFNNRIGFYNQIMSNH